MKLFEKTKTKLVLLGSSISTFIFSSRVLAEVAQPEYGVQPVYGVIPKYGIQPLYGMPAPLTPWEKFLIFVSRPVVIAGIALLFLAIGIFLIIKHRKGLNVKKDERFSRKRKR